MFAALRADERGTVTAEFAIVVPAVLAVLGLVIAGVFLAAQRVALTSAAAEIARLEARGDTGLAGERVSALGAGVEVDRASDGLLHCVTLRARPARGPLTRISVDARACSARIGDGLTP